MNEKNNKKCCEDLEFNVQLEGIKLDILTCDSLQKVKDIKRKIFGLYNKNKQSNNFEILKVLLKSLLKQVEDKKMMFEEPKECCCMDVNPNHKPTPANLEKWKEVFYQYKNEPDFKIFKHDDSVDDDDDDYLKEDNNKPKEFNYNSKMSLLEQVRIKKIKKIKTAINNLNDVYAVKELKEWITKKDLAERTIFDKKEMKQYQDLAKQINSIPDLISPADELENKIKILENKVAILEDEKFERQMQESYRKKNEEFLTNTISSTWMQDGKDIEELKLEVKKIKDSIIKNKTMHNKEKFCEKDHADDMVKDILKEVNKIKNTNKFYGSFRKI